MDDSKKANRSKILIAFSMRKYWGGNYNERIRKSNGTIGKRK